MMTAVFFFYASPEFNIKHHWLCGIFCVSITVNLDFLQQHTFTHLTVIFLFNSSSLFIQVSLLYSFSEDALQGRAPSSSGLPLKKITKSPDTFTYFLRLFASHVDRQLHFTGIILDGNILIMPVNCQRSTLSSIISDSFEFLLAALTHKFHKIEKQHSFFPLSPQRAIEIWERLVGKKFMKMHCLFGFNYQNNICPIL